VGGRAFVEGGANVAYRSAGMRSDEPTARHLSRNLKGGATYQLLDDVANLNL
jgi:hypothetical protein